MLNHAVTLMGTVACFAANSCCTEQKHDMASSDMTIRGRKLGAKTIKRLRLNVDDYISKMSGREFRRCYRMDKELFYIINILDKVMDGEGGAHLIIVDGRCIRWLLDSDIVQ